jgi:hypothetical protein
MKCPLCEKQLPDENPPVMCPACGAKLNSAGESAAGKTGDHPVLDGILMVVKVILWTLAMLVGTALVVLSVLFAGCVCSSTLMRH